MGIILLGSLPAGRLMAYHDKATENEIIFASASSSDDRISEARQDAGGQADRYTDGEDGEKYVRCHNRR